MHNHLPTVLVKLGIILVAVIDKPPNSSCLTQYIYIFLHIKDNYSLHFRQRPSTWSLKGTDFLHLGVPPSLWAPESFVSTWHVLGQVKGREGAPAFWSRQLGNDAHVCARVPMGEVVSRLHLDAKRFWGGSLRWQPLPRNSYTHRRGTAGQPVAHSD